MDQLEFEAFFKQTSHKLLNYLSKIVKNREDAEDILQSSYIALFDNREKVDPDKYVNYLYRTAHNKALNFKKKSSKVILHNLVETQAGIQEWDSEKIRESKNQKIRIAFQNLPPKMALVLELQFYKKMSYKEIARFMNISEKAVDSLLVRAKRKIRQFFMQNYPA